MMLRTLLLTLLLLSSAFTGQAYQKGKPKTEPAPTPETTVASPRVDSTKLKALKARAIGPAVMGGRVSDVAFDPHHPYTFYVGLGTGGIMKTTDQGGTFQAVFANEPVASIGAIAVSPSDPKIVWVGTGEAADRNSVSWGDGVYRSTDAGATWTHVGLKSSRIIARIVVHPTDPATALVASVGDLWGPGPERGLYKTTDAGTNWTAVLKAPEPYQSRVGCCDVVLDPSNPDVVYAAMYARQRTPWSFVAGTEFSLFVSLDRGGSWLKFGDLPTVAVDDLIIHPRDRDLVVATHGRSLFIVDDLRPLEELTSEVQSRDAHLFSIRPALGFKPLPGFEEWGGKAVFRGENPPTGALINFWIGNYTGDAAKLKITTATGQPVANLSAPGNPGINRVIWDLKPTKDLLTEYGGEGQKFVQSGEYVVTLTYGKIEQTERLKVEIAEGIETR
ncbi:MAG: hypothetical protein HY650_14285 [Acidobacteria bacterium]|nr:hypothetical protein [Acidobacteriota bacterium]